MLVYRKNTDKIRNSAEFIIATLGGGKPGEDVVFISDSACRENAFTLADVSRELGLNPVVIDIDSFGRDARYLSMKVMKPLKAAILASDLSFMLTDQMLTDFGMFLGNSDECDTALLGANRRFTLEARGLEEWDLDREEILHSRERTEKLTDLLRKGGLLKVTTERGTSFECDMGRGTDAIYPVMAILPFYAETAVIPRTGFFNGKLVVDGASQCAYAQRGFPVRPAVPGHQELYMEPLVIELKDGVVSGYSGPRIQVERLEKWMYSSTPNAVLADEIGIVTTTSPENDKYGWLIDGTHQTHCVHVALGNNTRRGEIIHAPEHCDFDMHEPTITLDGKILYQSRLFNDELIFNG
ncbi:MAG: hypothetical protein BWY31_04473 [Lentisphaerae bacterium ADurb.Bin242]|nr:MAG: hypothetical protein BWY31_04473 [Lentisphaerae bacterium ADurb.Bin242]